MWGGGVLCFSTLKGRFDFSVFLARWACGAYDRVRLSSRGYE